MISNATSLTKITYKQPELLWENPATTYGGGVLNFSGNYSMYIVEFTGLNSSTPRNIKMALPLSDTGHYYGVRASNSSTTGAVYIRWIHSVRNNSINIGNGYTLNDTSSSDSAKAVPLKIWGIPA